MATFEEIIAPIENLSEEDKKLIKKAYDFAEEAHKNQKRFSGDPYFLHLTETAKILAETNMGALTISAGLLHDSIEDANITPETIEKEFGKEIMFMVEGVTKLGKLRYRGVQRYVESLRKLFVAMSQDLRVLIIKLCDRLHNKRTLEYVRPEKQRRIALETIEIYAPLAYRLGIRKLNRELEDLAFPYVYPEEYKKAKKLLKKKSQETSKNLEKLRKSIMKYLAKSGITRVHIDYRIKGIYSLYKKLERKEWDIDAIYDIMATRVIVKNVEDCYKALGLIHGHWRPLPGRIKDYIAFPKPNGYQSLHTTIFTGDGGITEVQIRTEEMHKDSEYGIASHFGYKENFDEKSFKNRTATSWLTQFMPLFKSSSKLGGNSKNGVINGDVPTWLKELAKIETKPEHHEEFINDIKADFFKNRVFVFTPKGDVVDLPYNATPIDFAYAIHSNIGDHMSGVKINGKLVSIDTPLKNGDIVEVQVKENSKPTTRWVEIAKTSLAKRHIKGLLSKKK
jgi:GTP pyrophosphokinase